MQSDPIIRDIVLLGGGHAHAIVIKQWGMRPLGGVRMTLISRDMLTPYSGMLPGLIAGHYSVQDTHIDLSRLCQWAGVRFICAEIRGLQSQTRKVLLQNRPPIEYDLLSVDTGSTPDLASVQGAATHTTAVKPVHLFYDRWLALLARVQQSAQALRIGVVGGGAGGYEILQAIHYRLTQHCPQQAHQYFWLVRGQNILESFPHRAQTLALAECKRKNIQVSTSAEVERVTQNKLWFSNGQQLALDEIIWVTQATGPEWLQQSGLQLDERGFIAVDQNLQALNQPTVFAAGDVATQIHAPRPKAGVFAVRAGPVLAANLRKQLLGQSLNAFKPQKQFLSILANGEQSAIASRAMLVVSGQWVWRWKDHIDRKFMDKFHRLPPMTENRPKTPEVLNSELVSQALSQPAMRCSGCGAKVSGDVLSSVLKELAAVVRDTTSEPDTWPEDASITDPRNNLLVQSVDQLRSVLDDPYVFAQIATQHALSDLFAMGADPDSVMAMINLPYASDEVLQRELTQLMHGVTRAVNAAGGRLNGGHSSESAELSIGLVANGFIKRDFKAFSKGGLQVGDKIILSKAIGSGLLLRGQMLLQTKGPDLQQAVTRMLQSNHQAAEVLLAFHASAVTDVTGFGLAGHLSEMLSLSRTQARLDLDSIPVMPGSQALAASGVRSTLYDKNLHYCESLSGSVKSLQHPTYELLFDPQTSGGLLAGVAEKQARDCIKALQNRGYADARIIGVVDRHSSDSQPRLHWG